MRRFFILQLGVLLLSCSVRSQTPALTTRDVIQNLDTPWEVLWGPDDMIWFTERGGRVSRLNPETGSRQIILTIPDVFEQSESGLLGMVHHPDFPDSSFVYLVYNYRSGSAIKERVVRYSWDGDTLTGQQLIIEDLAGSGNHNGSRLIITADRKLLITTGDAATSSVAQDHTNLNGKILRMNLDGTVPADNPWPTAPGRSKYLYTTGHRNPQGLHLASNGILYSSEHGPNNDDEINIIVPGRNYGWPNVHGYCDEPTEQSFCNDSNVVEPIYAWTPTIATAGLDYYDNPAIPEWTNSLLLVTLKEQDLRQLKLSADGRQVVSETIFFDNRWGRLRDLCISPDGRVFIAVSERDGRGSPVATDDRIVELKSATPPNASIAITSVSSTNVTAGDSIHMDFTVTGEFAPGNVFTLQLSDAQGGFNIPAPIGVRVDTSGGRISGRIRCDAGGDAYRLRVVSTTPPVASNDNGDDVTIVGLTSPTIQVGGSTTICKGDSVVLDAGPGYSTYDWSSGEQTQSIVVRDGGGFTVTVRHANGCRTTSASVQIRMIDPTPAVQFEGDTLVANGGYTAYRWFRDGSVIDGATTRRYLPTSPGRYTVEGTTPEGCIGLSAEVIVEPSGVGYRREGINIRLSPLPARDRLVVELEVMNQTTLRLDIVDARGVVVRSVDTRADRGLARRELSTKELPAGAYFLRVRLDDLSFTRGFVKE